MVSEEKEKEKRKKEKRKEKREKKKREEKREKENGKEKKRKEKKKKKKKKGKSISRGCASRDIKESSHLSAEYSSLKASAYHHILNWHDDIFFNFHFKT